MHTISHSMQCIAPEVTSSDTLVRVRWEFAGIVQGVGFRPWIYRLAQEEGLAGWVANSSSGVELEVEGSPEAIERFARKLHRPPALARVAAVRRRQLAASGEADFAIRPSTIRPSNPDSGAGGEVAADTAPCRQCRHDVHDPANRRFKYPFTNCTACGPRYTITAGLPYDRPQTTMAGFVQCPRCQWEYEQAADRRFHAQPNACGECGPQLSMTLEEVSRRLRDGEIVALKSVGGYQLLCDAANAAAVERLRARKRRGRKPFALLARDGSAVEAIAVVSELEQSVLESPARPILLLDRRAGAQAQVAEVVAPGQARLGVMLPPSPAHELLFACAAPARLVATSGNVADLPLAASAEEAEVQLRGIADAFCHHNRPIQARCDDSVGFVWRGKQRLVRRARGYVPEAIELGSGGVAVWAAGGEMKNTFCLTRGREAHLSPHLGEMGSVESFAAAGDTLNHYMRLFGIVPQVLAYDPHPGYAVSRWAREQARARGMTRHIAVQHHHAHIAAVMAEHGLEGTVWGVAWDGTGWGSDATIWGGEFLSVSRTRSERRAWLRPLALVGGDQAVRQPWRLGLAWLVDERTDELRAEAARRAQALWPGIEPRRLSQCAALIRRPEWALACSSAGRYFDAAAVLMGAVEAEARMTFEGEAALALEAAAAGTPLAAEPYPFAQDGAQVDLRPSLRALLDDRAAGLDLATMAARFHSTLAAVIVANLQRLHAAEGGTRVCLGGGVFQNRRLLELSTAGLERAGFEVYVPARVPANDGGLALGQAAVARARVEAEGKGAGPAEAGVADS